MISIRKVLKIALYVFLALLATALVVIALNFTYLKRSFTGFSAEQVRDISWFEPKTELVASADLAPIFLSEETFASQDAKYSEAIDYAESMNSSAFLVWQGGELVVEKYWAPYNADSYTQTHSVHKSLLSMVVGVALDEGAIESVQDPVSKYLGDWIDLSMGEITIEHLLNMSSGLGETEPPSFFLFAHFLRLLNSTDISKVAQGLPQKLAPGQEFEYINNNPQLLLDVLEVATGQPYETYLEEKIWSKMAANPGYLWMDREGGSPHGYCCLMALPEDLLRIGLLVLNEGRVGSEQVVPQAWVQQAIAPSELNPNYGYLIWRGTPHTPLRKYAADNDFGVIHSEPYLAEDVLFFDGFAGQRVYVVPSRDLVIVRVGEMRFDFDDSALPNRIIQALGSNEPDSDFGIAYTDLEIEAEHAGQINLRVSYPQDGEGSYPLVLFSHGHYLTNDAYHHLTDEWVDAGYVVIAPQHIDTGDWERVAALSEELGTDWITAARVLDMKAALDQMERIIEGLDNFDGVVETENVIAAGHSMGALIAQYLAGATHEAKGNSVFPMPEQLNDERVTAVVAVSPPGPMVDYLTDKTWQSFAAPQLVVTGTEDYFPGIWDDHTAHFLSYQAAQPGDNYLLVMEDVDHYFGNLLGRLNLDSEPKMEALQNVAEISLLFMDSYLGRDSEAEGQLMDVSSISELSEVTQYETR